MGQGGCAVTRRTLPADAGAAARPRSRSPRGLSACTRPERLIVLKKHDAFIFMSHVPLFKCGQWFQTLKLLRDTPYLLGSILILWNRVCGGEPRFSYPFAKKMPTFISTMSPRCGGRQTGNPSSASRVRCFQPVALLDLSASLTCELWVWSVWRWCESRGDGWVAVWSVLSLCVTSSCCLPDPCPPDPHLSLRTLGGMGFPELRPLMLGDLGRVVHHWDWMLSIEEYIYFFRKEKFQL